MPDELNPDASIDEEQKQDALDASGGDADNAAPADESASDSSAEPMDDLENLPGDEFESADSGLQEQDDFNPVVNNGDASEEDAEAAMLKMLEAEGQEAAAGSDSSAGLDDADEFPDLSGVQMEEPRASKAEFQQLNPSPNSGSNNIDMLLDVKMPVSIELGRTEMPISELLTLGPGSVVELNKLAGEPVDLLVNGKIIARGEVVVVDENFGVRITLLLSPEERLKSLAQE